ALVWQRFVVGRAGDVKPHSSTLPERKKQGPERGLVAKLSLFGMRWTYTAWASFADSLATILDRIGLSTNNAKPTTTRFMIVVSRNTMCQLPVDALIMLATGTRKADAPFAV